MLGSNAWRRYIVQATKTSEPNWHDAMTLFLAKNLSVSTIESMTNQRVRELQRKGYGVCGLTARQRNRWYDTPMEGTDILTIQQLESANIQFDQKKFAMMYPNLARNTEYFGGIFFVDTNLKGDFLTKIFTSEVERPSKTIFIDDKLSQVESVDSALNELEIDHECYWYCATNDKATKFNPLIANIQLFYFLTFNTIFSDLEAGIIAEKYPEQNADDYFQLILDTPHFKTKLGM